MSWAYRRAKMIIPVMAWDSPIRGKLALMMRLQRWRKYWLKGQACRSLEECCLGRERVNSVSIKESATQERKKPSWQFNFSMLEKISGLSVCSQENHHQHYFNDHHRVKWSAVHFILIKPPMTFTSEYNLLGQKGERKKTMMAEASSVEAH